MKSPVLSICVSGRDDNYIKDFKLRITTTLNHYAHSLKSLGKLEQVEILIVDWGSKNPLSQSLALSPSAIEICRFLYVPQETIDITQDEKEQFHTTRAWNVALRNAHATFIFLSNADQLMPPHALDSLLRLLNRELPVPIDIDECLMLMPRLELPWQYLQREVKLEDLDKYLFFNEYAMFREPVPPQSYIFGSTAGFVFSKKVGVELGGVNEAQSGWGESDIEFCFRATRARNYVYLSSLGIYQFHMEHPPNGPSKRTIANKLIWSSRSMVNDLDWGLGGHSISEQKAENRMGTASMGVEIHPENDYLSASSEQIVSEIQSEMTMQHVAETLMRLNLDDWHTYRSKISILPFLAWYSLFRFPRRYLELGKMEADGYAVVAGACPSAEICGLETFEGKVADRRLMSIFITAVKIGIRSQFRMSNGELGDSIQRLKSLSSVYPDFDLIYIRKINLKIGGIPILKDFMRVLSNDGALVIGSEEEPFLDSECRELTSIAAVNASELFRSADNRAAMIIKGSLDRKAIPQDGILENVLDFDAFAKRVGIRSEPASWKRRIVRRIWKDLKKLRDRYADTF